MRDNNHEKRGGRKRIGIVIAVVLLVVAVAVGIVYAVSPKKSAEKTSDTSSSSSSNKEPAPSKSDTPKENNDAPTPEPSSTKDVTGQASTLDPETVGSIDITPMSITVSYVKGIGGFEFEVHRTPSGTQYVDFLSSDLVGTKCTDDQGVFATILESPESDEQSTLTKTIKLGNTTYGLSLAEATCTGDPDKLSSYQQSFSDAFNLLKTSE